MGPGSLFKAGEMLHHGGMREEEVSERVFVASRWHTEGIGWRASICCIVDATHYGFYVMEMLHHSGCRRNRIASEQERCCITVAAEGIG